MSACICSIRVHTCVYCHLFVENLCTYCTYKFDLDSEYIFCCLVGFLHLCTKYTCTLLPTYVCVCVGACVRGCMHVCIYVHACMHVSIMSICFVFPSLSVYIPLCLTHPGGGEGAETNRI